MNIDELKINNVLKNKRSGIEYVITKFINSEVVEVKNLKHIGMIDYINNSTICDYEIVS